MAGANSSQLYGGTKSIFVFVLHALMPYQDFVDGLKSSQSCRPLASTAPSELLQLVVEQPKACWETAIIEAEFPQSRVEHKRKHKLAKRHQIPDTSLAFLKICFGRYSSRSLRHPTKVLARKTALVVATEADPHLRIVEFGKSILNKPQDPFGNMQEKTKAQQRELTKTKKARTRWNQESKHTSARRNT